MTALRSLYDGLFVHRYPPCCVLHFVADELVGHEDAAEVRGVVLRPTAGGPASRYVPCALHLRQATRLSDLHVPGSGGKAAPVFFDSGTLQRWGAAKVVDATDDGTTGTVTVRYSGTLRRTTCSACDGETVAADNAVLNYCPWCGERLTSTASRTPYTSAAALSALGSGGSWS